MSDAEKQGKQPVEGEQEPTELEALRVRIKALEAERGESRVATLAIVGLLLTSVILMLASPLTGAVVTGIVCIAALAFFSEGKLSINLGRGRGFLARILFPDDKMDYLVGLGLALLVSVGLFLLAGGLILLIPGEEKPLYLEEPRFIPWTAIIALTASPVAILTLNWRTLHKRQDLENQRQTHERESQNQRRTHERDESRILNERYVKAVELLGSAELSTRLGAIYALEQLAADSAKHHWTVIETLCAFIRNAPRPEGVEASVEEAPTDRGDEDANKPQPKPTADVQAALDVIGRRSEEGREEERAEGRKLDLNGACLEGASLVGAHLERANLRRAHLEGANLSRANLERAVLGGARLEGANLSRARLEGAYLRKAHLERTDLSRANLERAVLAAAHLEGADLSGANLERAVLAAAHLEGADLSRANLERAVLATAHLEGALRQKDKDSTPAGWTAKPHFIDDVVLLTKAPTDEEP